MTEAQRRVLESLLRGKDPWSDGTEEDRRAWHECELYGWLDVVRRYGHSFSHVTEAGRKALDSADGPDKEDMLFGGCDPGKRRA